MKFLQRHTRDGVGPVGLAGGAAEGADLDGVHCAGREAVKGDPPRIPAELTWSLPEKHSFSANRAAKPPLQNLKTIKKPYRELRFEVVDGGCSINQNVKVRLRINYPCLPNRTDFVFVFRLINNILHSVIVFSDP